MWLILIASYLFYALAGIKFIPVLIALSFLTYWLAIKKKQVWGVLINLAVLGLFKYWNFGVENINSLIKHLGIESLTPLLTLGLPLGISFYVFKHIGYLLETRNGHYPPTEDFLAFAVYSAFFPQISAGPISDFKHTTSQFEILPQKLSSSQAYDGLIMISIGLAKKVLIADTVASSIAIGAAGTVSGFFPAWYLVIAYAIQLYFDFSGYSDMALGTARLFGINLPANFNNPYQAVHIGQFWERWHISLSTWFRFYLFFPISRSLLGKYGAKHKDWAQVVATLVTMTLIGLWHGAAWTFVLWGVYHGLLLCLNTWFNPAGRTRLPVWIQRSGLLLAVLFGWAIFMSPNVAVLGHLLSQMVGLGGLGSVPELLELAVNAGMPAVLLGIFLSFSGFAEADSMRKKQSPNRGWASVALGIFAAICILLMGSAVNFLYMQF